jgi:hypothetical protein
MAAIAWTRFLDRAATSARELQHEWRELVEHLQHAGPYPAKSVCPWIKLARFGQSRSVKGALRHDSNILQITGVEGDYDGEQMQPEEAIALLERAQLRAIVYTSPSHTPAAPRWRVLAPLAEPMPPAARSALLARINGALGGVLTPESFTLSQSYYYGRVEGQADYRVLVTFDDPEEGVTVDQADELDDIAIGRPARAHVRDGVSPGNCIAARVEQLGRRLRTGDGRRDLLKTYIGDRSNRGLSSDEIRTLLEDITERFFDPADPIDWSNVNQLITDITDADTAHREQVHATVGGFIERITAPPASTDLPLVFAETINGSQIAIAQLVEDVLTEGGLSVIYGESNSGKSFLACDMACSLASGIEWLGKRTVQGAVLYVAGEGSESIKLRVLAWRQKHQLDPQLAVVPVAVNLLKANADAMRVVAACKAVEAHYGAKVALVVIDTLARAFAGGNENASEDMSAVIAHADLIRMHSGAHVMFIHHSGKDSAKGSRGHSSLKAATDTEIEVTAEEATKLHTAEIRKQRDLGSRGEKITAKFTVVKMGMVDQWGKPVTTCVVDPTDEKPAGKSKKARGTELEMALCAILKAAPNMTMQRKELVAALEAQGFKTSPAYDAIRRLNDPTGRLGKVLEESAGRVKLLNIAGALLMAGGNE